MSNTYPTKTKTCVNSDAREGSAVKSKRSIVIWDMDISYRSTRLWWDSRLFAVMTSTWEQRSLVWVAFVSAAELCLENHCSVHNILLPYELWNVNSIKLVMLGILLLMKLGGHDYWKSDVIAFVDKFCSLEINQFWEFTVPSLIFSCINFRG